MLEITNEQNEVTKEFVEKKEYDNVNEYMLNEILNQR